MTTTTPATTNPCQRGCSGEATAGPDACPPEKEEKKKRITEYLDEPQDDDEMHGSRRVSWDLYPSPSITCKTAVASLSSTLRSLLMEKTAWFHWRGRRGKKKKKKNDTRKERNVQKERGTRKTTPSASETIEERTKDVGGLPPCFSTSGGKPAEAFFNIGMGLGITYVLARWASEFDKMSELHVQMELLLKELKQQVPTKCISPSIPGQDKTLASSSSDWSREIGTENGIFPQSQQILVQMEGDNSPLRSTNDKTSPHNKGCPRMEELEAELELELEQLQLYLEADPVVHSEQERMEMPSDSIKSRESFLDDSEPKEENYDEYYGVSARELERRLHELLHTRQQEQIAELEAALKLALFEKEIEVSRWREAAKNASNRVGSFGEDL